MPQNMYNNNNTWVAPSNIWKNEVTVECWGGGGAGGASNLTTAGNQAGGGGGGAYAKSVVTVTPTTGYTIVAGAGGAQGAANNAAGNPGTYSSFNNNEVMAQPGLAGGGTASGAGGNGGNAGNSIGQVVWPGGNGGTECNNNAGGAGGSAGAMAENGANNVTAEYFRAGIHGESRGNGPMGGSPSGQNTGNSPGAGGNAHNTAANQNGNVGLFPGGGGGAGRGGGTNTTRRGGNGALGGVRVTWQTVTHTISGVTRDKNGNVLVSCTVRLYKLSGGVVTFLEAKTSDGTTGAYSFGTYDGDATYMVTAHKSGDPNVFDCTDFTITPVAV